MAGLDLGWDGDILHFGTKHGIIGVERIEVQKPAGFWTGIVGFTWDGI
jgi:hypothetical protein